MLGWLNGMTYQSFSICRKLKGFWVECWRPFKEVCGYNQNGKSLYRPWSLCGWKWHFTEWFYKQIVRCQSTPSMEPFCGTRTSSTSTRSHPTGGAHRALRRPSDLNLRPLPGTHHHQDQNWTLNTILGFMYLSLHFCVLALLFGSILLQLIKRYWTLLRKMR